MINCEQTPVNSHQGTEALSPTTHEELDPPTTTSEIPAEPSDETTAPIDTMIAEIDSHHDAVTMKQSTRLSHAQIPDLINL